MRTFSRLMAAALLVPSTMALAGAPPAQASCTVTSIIRGGNDNAQVLCLEQRLAALGYNVGTPNTYFGSLTTTAVKSFQQSRGLYPDGVLHSHTSRQLGLRGIGAPDLNPIRATVVGDSTSAAMRWYDETSVNNNTVRYDTIGNSYDTIMSVESCRRLVVTSCVGRVDPGTGAQWRPVSVLPLMQGDLRGKLGQVLVVMAGYDDTSVASAITQIMAEANAQGVTKVLWLNYKLTNSYPNYQQYYIAHNQALENAKRLHPNLVVLDWNGYSAGQTSWFTSDGIHITPSGATALGQYIKTSIDQQQLATCLTANATTGTPDPTSGTPTNPPAIPTSFDGIAPTRVFDSRVNGVGSNGTRVGAGRTVRIDLGAQLPVDAQSAVVSVSAVDPCLSGFLTVFSCGTRPNVSTINAFTSRTSTGMAIVGHDNGDICVYAHKATHLTVDLLGWFVSGANRSFVPLTPTRWVDTRGNAAQLSITGLRTGGQQTSVAVAGQGAVPADATAVWVNVTAAQPTANTRFTVYPGPCATAPPTTTVNALANRTAAAAALVDIGPDGTICVANGPGSTHLVLDVSGYVVPGSSGLDFYLGAQTRITDTRTGNAPPIAANTDVAVTINNVVVWNVVATQPADFGFTVLRPCGTAVGTSLLNTATLEPVANIGVVAPGTASQACVLANVASHFVVDQLGTFLSPP